MHELVLHSACFQPLFLVSNLLITNANVAFSFKEAMICFNVPSHVMGIVTCPVNLVP